MKEKIPAEIVAIRTVTYETEDIVTDIANDNDKTEAEVTLDEVMEVIRRWALDDFDCDASAISYRDQDNELVEG